MNDYTRNIAQILKFDPVVPPKSNRKNPWVYDKELYKRPSEIERFFRLIQGFRPDIFKTVLPRIFRIIKSKLLRLSCIVSLCTV